MPIRRVIVVDALLIAVSAMPGMLPVVVPFMVIAVLVHPFLVMVIDAT